MDLRFGKRVVPRKYDRCFQCQQDTVQWLVGIRPYSPGSYRGTRITQQYVCSNCGEITL